MKVSDNLKRDILDEAFYKAVETLKKCSTKNGFYASGGYEGYDAVWSRDSMITSLGASLLPEFKEVFKSSIKTLAKNQSKNGQIPNAVDKWSKRKPHIDFKTIDSSLWFIIGNYIYKNRFNKKLFKKYKENIEKTLIWLRCQDLGENGMLAQLPTSDWQDAFPHRYGYTINTQALYYKVLNLRGNKKEAYNLKKLVNEDKEDGLWLEDYYVSYRWKNHGKYKEIGDWFDSLGNLLAIIFDLADKKRGLKILNYIEKKRINKPSAIKCIYPPIDKKSNYWQDYYLDCNAGIPNNYSNGGIWGYIGCFYVLALIKYKQYKKAGEELKKIAEFNLKYNFPEWIHAIKKTAEKNNQFQAWEAGMYILAYECFKNKKIFI